MRRAALFLLLALGATRLHAQAAASLIGGLSWAHLLSSASSSNTERGFAAGLGLTLPMGRTVSVAPELLYVEKGFKPGPNDPLAGCCTRMNYVELPLLLRLTTGQKPQQFVVYAGPHLAYLISCHSTDESVVVALRAQEASASSCADATYFPVRRLDYGLTVGAGFHIGRTVLSVRYDYGLSNISDLSSIPSVHNRTLMALIGLDLK